MVEASDAACHPPSDPVTCAGPSRVALQVLWQKSVLMGQSRDVEWVLHVVPQMRLGAGRYVVDTALQQAREGLHVSVAVGQDAEPPWCSDPALLAELRAASIRVSVAGDLFHRRANTLARAGETLRALLPPGEGITHAHTAMAAAVARWAGARRVVATCHGWNVEREEAFNLQDALALRSADGITSPSAHWARLLERELGLHDVSVVPVGLDLRRYAPLPGARREDGSARIVAVAELTARKGIADLLEAMPAVWRDTPGAELHLFGDGDARGALEARAAQLDPAGRRVAFHGFVSSPYTRLPAFDVFCLPSRSDNSPVALMEAMLARLPVVGTDVGGIPELVGGAGCGRIVPPAAPAALAAAISAMLRLPAREKEALGASGERFIRRRCAIEVTVAQLAAVYAGAAAATRSPCA